MAPVAEVFIGALNVRMSILAMSLLMRPYTLTQTDQNTARSSCNGAGHTFFERDAAPVEEQPDRRGRGPNAVLGGKALPDLGERDIRRILDQAENEGLVCVQLRARRLALLARLRLAGRAITAIPCSGRRKPDPEAPGRLTCCRDPVLNRR